MRISYCDQCSRRVETNKVDPQKAGSALLCRPCEKRSLPEAVPVAIVNTVVARKTSGSISVRTSGRRTRPVPASNAAHAAYASQVLSRSVLGRALVAILSIW
jgi:hypothetical protein